MSYQNETRLLNAPSVSVRAAFVTMSQTAWYWLDDLVKTKFPKGGYKALMREFGEQAATSPAALSESLRGRAQEHGHNVLSGLYNLANDNTASKDQTKLPPKTPLPSTQVDLSLRMPSCYRLFHFMPQATYLTTIWERRNYRRNQPRLDH